MAAKKEVLGFGERTAQMLMGAAKRKLASDPDEKEYLSLSRRMCGNTALNSIISLMRNEGSHIRRPPTCNDPAIQPSHQRCRLDANWIGLEYR